MKCPYCGSLKTYVTHGNDVTNGYKRYRKCSFCGKSFSAMERVVIVKRGKGKYSKDGMQIMW